MAEKPYPFNVCKECCKGDKPIKGVDYFTEEDEQQLISLVTEIVKDAINSLPNGDEVEY